MTQEKRDMKDSGVEWLGEIPVRWEIVKLGVAAEITAGQSPPGHTYNFDGFGLPFFQGKAEFGAFYPVPQKWCTEPQSICESGDILISVRAPVGDVNMAAELSCIGRGLAAIRVKETCNSQFLYRILLSAKHGIARQATGSTFESIPVSVLRNLAIPLPPLHEQRAIASYLDAETARIDKLIAKTERLNELLREKRTALISQAVTKGLDAGVALKESGGEWLGEIPRHWDVKRLKFCATIRTAHIDPTLREFSQRKLIAPNHIESSTGRLLEVDSAEEQGAISAKVPFQQGDVLYSKIRPNLHKVCIAPFDGLCSSDIYPLLPNGNIISLYFLYTILCKGFHQLTILQVMGATIPRINQESLMDILISLPPLHEQRAIAAYLDAETARIDRLIGVNDRLIHLLREKRSALISAAVTGKIAVPAVEPGKSC
ncbi:MAG: restriction endonuclease subunit S [Chloroflexi bacterium]|nr:restriction endonuclease subunit S [Chloroflexota bacterium]